MTAIHYLFIGLIVVLALAFALSVFGLISAKQFMKAGVMVEPDA